MYPSFYHLTLPIIFVISSVDIAPFLSILGTSEVRSIIVEASPSLHSPPSTKISTLDFIASDNSLYDLGVASPEILALVVAKIPPAKSII